MRFFKEIFREYPLSCIVIFALLVLLITTIARADEVREVNVNFSARQAVIYRDNGEAVNLQGDKFTPFENVKATCENSLKKTPQEIEKEKRERKDEIDRQIGDLQKQKEDLDK